MTIEGIESELLKVFTDEKPFGPTNATNLLSHPQLFKRILDPQNKITERFKYDPSLIIGRRGSGKTSFLFGIQSHQVRESLSTAKTFSEIVHAINSKADSFLFHENVAELWEHLLTLALFRSTARRFNEPSVDVRTLLDYCAKNGLGENDAVEDWLWRVVRIARTKVKNDTVVSVADIVSELAGANYKEALAAFNSILEKNKARAILLIDSLEQYPVGISSVAHAIAGLLLCVGEFNERNERHHVRVCLPAEMYHEFMAIAPNPVKNFSHAITLHWHSLELLSIAANRLKIYLALHYPKYGALSKDHIEPKKAVHFLRQFLPEKVTNGFGNEEDTIAYILRHTQLMPRHLLRILNKIFQEAHSSGLGTYPVISADYIVAGIKKAEVRLAEEVCSAFIVRYPKLQAVCEKVVPYLPYRFTDGALQRVFRQHGQSASKLAEYDDFKRMLIETAVIGRISGEEDGQYIRANFEYTAAHKLITSTEDEFCIHPIFAEVYHFKRTKDARPVYPYGTDPTSPDYRDIDEI